MDVQRPRFLLVHSLDVHQWKPWYFDKQHPDTPRSELRQDGLKASYREALRDTDAGISALLQGWDRQVGLSRSLVVFYADHGESLLDPGSGVGHGNSMNEELLHVPLMVRYPDSGATGPRRDDRRASLMDIFPTVLEVAGIAASDLGPDGGRSLLAPETPRRVLFADFESDAQAAEQDLRQLGYLR